MQNLCFTFREDLPEFQTLTLCIKESLRLNTAVPFISRELTEDMYIDGYYVPKGTLVNVNMYAIMHNPEVWDDPNVR